MLSIDKEAIIELLGLEAVPVGNTLKSLLGRNVKLTVSDVEETSIDTLADTLPHFNVIIEGKRTAEGGSASMLYVFRREDMVRLINYIMGLAADTPSPLDEIALSTLKEVGAQCIRAAVEELNDFLGRDMTESISRVTAYDNAESVREIAGRWHTDQPLLLIHFRYEVEGLVDSEAYGIAPQELKQVLGIPEFKEEPESRGLPHSGSAVRSGRSAVPVQEVSFPEFRYLPLEYRTEEIGSERKKLLEINMDVSVRIGNAVCSVRDILDLREGQVLVLDKQAGSPADVVVNGCLVGRGDVLVTGDHFGARIIEIESKRE